MSILIAGQIHYQTQKNKIFDAAKNELAVIVDLKAGEIVQWRNDYLADGKFISENQVFIHQVDTFFKNPNETQTRVNLVTWMISAQTSLGFSNIILYDLDGVSRLVAGPIKDSLGLYAHRLISDVLLHHRFIFSDLYKEDASSKIHLDLVMPLMRHDKRDSILVGVIMLRFDPDKILFPLIQSRPTLNRTAETLLLRSEGDSVLFLNELLHRKNAALTLRLPISLQQLPAAMAARGFEGKTEGIDYRNVPVLASMKRIPNSPWFMVAKVDREEIYTPFREQMTFIMLIVVSSVLVVASMLGLWWRYQQAKHNKQQYQMEQERRALILHFDYLIKYANDIIVLANKDLNIIEANDRALETYGYTRNELIGLNFKRLSAPQTAAQLPDRIKLLDEMKTATYETIHQRKDGSTFPIELSARVVEIERYKYYQTIGRDITERKQVEEALRQSEEEFRKVFEEGKIGIALVKQDSSYIKVNQAFASMVGYSPEELCSKTYEMLTHTDDLKESLTNARALWRGDLPSYKTEKRYIHKDGSIVWAYLASSVIRDKNGNPLYFLTMVQDITESKQAEEKIRQLNEELEQRVKDRTAQLEVANKELESFAYSVSHDLRAPLRGIDGWSLALQEDFDKQLNEQAHEDLNRIRSETQRMGQLIDDLLKLSRVTRTEMELTSVDLTALAHSIIARMQKENADRKIDFIIQPGLSSWGDANLLDIVLTNLFENACKFTNPRVLARIEFGKTDVEGKPAFFIRDNGVGFDMQYAQNLFGAFQRMHRLSEFPGTGIGLATVQRIIHRHGGRIWADAHLDSGSTFYFTL
jgi:PAS domain S-box-containing protein